MDWKTLLACITGSVDENLLLRIEYLVTENRILRDQIKGRVQLSNAERQTLAEIGAKLGKQALEEVASIVQPDTILGWQRKLAAEKFDGSKRRKSLGRPRVDKELEDWVVNMAKENRSWGYDRIVGALAELGYDISDQTVGNILKRRGIPPAPERQKTTTWKEFIRSHLDMLWATDLFSTEVWTLGGLVTFYVLFFIKPVPFGQPVRLGQWELVPVVSHSLLVGCVWPRHRSPRTSDATSATAPSPPDSVDSARGRVPCSGGSAAGTSSER